jgi:PEP-CTERM motif
MRKLAFIGALVSLAAASTAGAQPVQAGAPAPSSTSLNFNSLAVYTPVSNQWLGQGVTITSSCFMTSNLYNSFFAGDPMQVINFDPSNGSNCNGGHAYPTVTVSFSSAINYFGLVALSANNLTLTDANGSITANAAAAPVFVGLNDAAGFSWVTISADQMGAFVGDNFSFGATVVATPEPATLVLFATGMLAVGVAAKRKRSKA